MTRALATEQDLPIEDHDKENAGYDELSAEAAAKAVGEGDEHSAKLVRAYERDHKDRASVIETAD